VAWGAYSLTGGFVFGMVHRPLSPMLLPALLGALTIPLGLASGWAWLCLFLVPAGVLCAPSLAATADAVSRLAPAGARGEAMGLYGSALTAGMAAGAPLAGAVIDASTPAWGFAVVGLVGATAALAALSLSRLGRERTGQALAGRAAGGSGQPAGTDQPGLVGVDN
jgi:predicted MFS family arabinose efflux permease